jgi:hypothetical protein
LPTLCTSWKSSRFAIVARRRRRRYAHHRRHHHPMVDRNNNNNNNNNNNKSRVSKIDSVKVRRVFEQLRVHIVAILPVSIDVATPLRPMADTASPTCLLCLALLECVANLFSCEYLKPHQHTYHRIDAHLMTSSNSQWRKPKANSNVLVAKRAQRNRRSTNVARQRARQHIACSRSIRQMLFTIVLFWFVKFSLWMSDNKRRAFDRTVVKIILEFRKTTTNIIHLQSSETYL